MIFVNIIFCMGRSKLSHVKTTLIIAFSTLGICYSFISEQRGHLYSKVNPQYNNYSQKLKIKCFTYHNYGLRDENNSFFPFSNVSLCCAKRECKYKNFDEFLMQQRSISEQNDEVHQQLIIVAFMSPFCGPCQKMKSELAKVKHNSKNLFTVVTIDADKYPKLSMKYNITGEKKLMQI